MSIYLLSPISRGGTIALPMIRFSLREVTLDFTGIDLLLFSSSQAVRSTHELNKSWKNTPCLAIGEATKKTIEALGGKVIYTPKDFYAQTLAADIVSKFKDKTILYLRPSIVSFDVKAFLNQSNISLNEIIIYETSCIAYTIQDKPEKDAVIIFTSPSTIHCFLENFTWDKSYTAIVIGESTKKHLPANARCVVADKPMIEACIDKAKELLTPNRL